MISETVLNSYKEAVERLEAENKVLKEELKKEKETTKRSVDLLEKIKLEKEVLLQEKRALEEKIVDQAIGSLKEAEKKRIFEGKFSAADELPLDWKQKFWALPRTTRARLEAEAVKRLDVAQAKIPRLAEYYTENILLPKVLKEKKLFIPTKKEQKRIEETELRARKQQLESLIKKTKTTEARIFLLESELKKNDN